jgi:hypothetical protein
VKEFRRLCGIYDEEENVAIVSIVQGKLKKTDSIIDGDTDRILF